MKKFINKIKNNPKLYFLSILIVGVFFVLVVRITFAYLAPAINKIQREVVGTSDTVDDFKFSLGNPIKLSATPTTLPENGTNYVSSTTATAYLKANSTNESAAFNYYVYFQIETNTFKYSDGTTPEIILTVTDPNGNELTSLSGLTYGTFSGISGFDITIKRGMFEIANNYEITSNSSKNYNTQDWTFTITYLNLAFDQSSNFGNNMSVNIFMKKEGDPPYHESCNDDTLACHVAKLYNGNQGSDYLYYHDGTLENGLFDNSYRYAGGSDSVNNFVCFGSTQSPCPYDNLYRIVGVFGDNYHGVQGKHLVKIIKYDYATSDLLGTDNDYEGLYTDEDTYYKGLNYGSIASYYWNKSTSTNTWSESSLNQGNLNVNFLNNIGDYWANTIASTTWKVGGNSFSNIAGAIPSVAYQNEVISPVPDSKTGETVYTAKIGLLYTSDYGFASSPSLWGTMLYYCADLVANDNWMYMGLNEWTISHISDDSTGVFFVSFDGYVSGSNVGILNDYYYAVRPAFSLDSSVAYVSGDGSVNNPFIID